MGCLHEGSELQTIDVVDGTDTLKSWSKDMHDQQAIKAKAPNPNRTDDETMCELQEIDLSLSPNPLCERAESLIADARRIAKAVKCFDFVPSNYELAWKTLAALPIGRFCEWGSGLGIVTGLAELLGFEACGIEMDFNLCCQSRELLKSHGLHASITHGNYFESETRADIFYVYCWPSRIGATEELFEKIAISNSLLIICYGQDDFRGRAPRQRSDRSSDGM